jgi:hypothetical protein
VSVAGILVEGFENFPGLGQTFINIPHQAGASTNVTLANLFYDIHISYNSG